MIVSVRLVTDRSSCAVYLRHTLVMSAARSVNRCAVVVLLGISVAVRGVSGSFWRRFSICCILSLCAVRQLFVACTSILSVVTGVGVAG